MQRCYNFLRLFMPRETISSVAIRYRGIYTPYDKIPVILQNTCDNPDYTGIMLLLSTFLMYYVRQLNFLH